MAMISETYCLLRHYHDKNWVNWIDVTSTSVGSFSSRPIFNMIKKLAAALMLREKASALIFVLLS